MSYEYNKRWRIKHPGKRRDQKNRYYKKFEQGAFNARERWTTREINLITGAGDLTDAMISKKIGRSVRAIQLMRHKLNPDKATHKKTTQ